MQIVIISDTHIYSIQNLPNEIIAKIRNSDAVIHAGDMVGKNFYEELKVENKNLYAVRGNMDSDIQDLDEMVKFKLGYLKFGLTHGHIYNNLYNGLIYNFSDCNIVVFGHTHAPYFKKENDLWLLNPGSTSKNRWKNTKTYAILKIYKDNFDVEFYEI